MTTTTERDLMLPGDPRRPADLPDRLVVYRDGRALRESRWGQYVLRHPQTGEWKTWQRATTFISMAEYAGEGLTDYQIRHALAGLVRRPDLLVAAAKLSLPDKHRDDKDRQDELKGQWKEIAQAAHEESGGNIAAQNGDEIHAATEFVDRGNQVDDLPTAHVMPDGRVVDLSRWRKHVEAYLELKAEAGIETFPELVERQVVNSDYGVAGTFDRLVLIKLKGEREPRWRVLDVKSGDVDFRDKFGRQMYLYATADGMWNEKDDTYDQLPDDIDTEVGLVVHIPWWQENPVATLIPVSMTRAGGPDGLAACSTVKTVRGQKAPKLADIASAMAPQPVVEEAVVEEPVAAVKKIPAPRKRAAKKAAPTLTLAAPTFAEQLLAATTKAELLAVRSAALVDHAELTEEEKLAGKTRLAQLA